MTKILMVDDEKEILEKRRSTRLNVHARVQRQLFKSGKSGKNILCKDVSGGGIRLVLDSPLRVGERLKLAVYFPKHPGPIHTLSQVVWCHKKTEKGKNEFEVGARHIRITSKDRKRFMFLLCEMMMNSSVRSKASRVRK